MKKIKKICDLIKSLTDKDFAEANELASAQANYVHPLKNKTASIKNKIGSDNINILKALKVLKTTIDKTDNK